MKLRVVVGMLFVLEMLSPMLFAAKFRCGFLKQKVETTLAIPRPPDVLILGRNIQVVVAETPTTLNREDENHCQQVKRRSHKLGFLL